MFPPLFIVGEGLLEPSPYSILKLIAPSAVGVMVTKPVLSCVTSKDADKFHPINKFNEDELVMLEAILEMDDNDIYQYALNKKEIPESLNNRVFTLLKDYTLL